MSGLDFLASTGGVIVVIATAVMASASLGIRSRAAFIIATLVVAAAAIVFVSTALSFFELYQRGFVLAGHVLVLAVVAVGWIRAGRPRPPRGWVPPREIAWNAIREHQAVAVLGGAVVLALGVTAVLAVFVAPNNFDSMTYHLARVGYWLQYDSVLHFPGGSSRQLALQPNAEILQGWTMLLSNGDRFAQLVQWIAFAGVGICVYLGARMLRFSVQAALFAAFLFMTLPQPILQASTTQNDLVAALFTLSAGLFAVRAISTQSMGEMAIASMAFGLALGTKGTVFLAMPAMLLIVTGAVIRWRPPRRTLLRGAILAVAATIVLSGTNYVENTIETGSPFGGIQDAVERERPVLNNAAWMGWSFVDLPGFGNSWMVSATQEWAQKIIGPNAEKIAYQDYEFPVEVDTTIHEDFTAFGPLGFAVLLPLLMIYVMGRSAPRDRMLVALAALSFLVVMAITLAANPWIMRLPIMAVAIGSMLFARLFPTPWLRVLSVAIAVSVLIPALAQNAQKPLGFVNPLSFLRAERSTQQSGNQGAERIDTLNRINSQIPQDARIALVAGSDAWEYPFFGPQFNRYVQRIDPTKFGFVDPEALMREEDLDAIVLSGEDVTPPENVAVESLGSSTYLYSPASEESTEIDTPANDRSGNKSR